MSKVIIDVLTTTVEFLSDGIDILANARHDFEVLTEGDQIIRIDLGPWQVDMPKVVTSLPGSPSIDKGVLAFDSSASGQHYIEFQLKWQESDRMGKLVSFPEAAPRFVNSVPAAPRYVRRPPIAFKDSTGGALQIIRPQAGWTDSGGSAERGFIACRDSVGLRMQSPVGGVWLSDALVSGLTEDEIDSLVDVVHSMRTACGGLLGSQVPSELVLVSRTDLPELTEGEWPGVIVVDPTEFRTDREDLFHSMYDISRQIAACWWGGTCEIVGERAIEVEGGIRAASAILSSEHPQHPERSRPVRNYFASMASQSLWAAVLRRMRGKPDPTITGTVVTAIVERQSVEPYFLADLTNKYWGKRVRDSELLAVIES